MSKRIQSKTAFLTAAQRIVGDNGFITRAQIEQAAHEAKVPFPSWLTSSEKYRDKWGVYRLPTVEEITNAEHEKEDEISDASAHTILYGDSTVPEVDTTYIPSVNHDTLTAIIKSRRFHPTYINGRSGYGKTMTVEQICARENREFVFVGVNEETTEDHLLGGFRLINGETKFAYGPAALAMMRGAVLMLDEVDFGTTKILCLQRLMEGKPVYISRINKWIKPEQGFCPILTGNTKGRGDMTGRYIGTRAMNDAFLERVNTYLTHGAPSTEVEVAIVMTAMNTYECADEQFANFLVAWANKTREDFANRGVQDEICTRRLRQIVSNYAIHGRGSEGRIAAIRDAISRYDEVTVDWMLEAYKAFDLTINPPPDAAKNMGSAPTGTTAPF